MRAVRMQRACGVRAGVVQGDHVGSVAGPGEGGCWGRDRGVGLRVRGRAQGWGHGQRVRSGSGQEGGAPAELQG